MKKGLFILSLLCFSGIMMAQEVQEIKGAHPYKLSENEEVAPEFAHWSIIPHIGFSAFDGDFVSEAKHNVAVPSLGLALEYNFTPVWNVGIEYMYDMYAVTGAQGTAANNADTLLFGHMHKAGAYLSIDVINLFFPKAKKNILSIFPYVGAGGAWYKRSAYFKDDRYWGPDGNGVMTLYNPTHGRGNTGAYINADGKVAPDYDTKYNMIGYIQTGLNVEFNLNRSLALGLRASYTYFTRDYVDGRGYYGNKDSYASKNNDGIFDITLNMRFKLEAVKKTHVRNCASFDSWKKEAEPLVAHDTVIYHRHDSIIRQVIIREEERDNSQYYYVYFDNNSYELNDRGLVTIQQVADRMNEDEELYAVVTGFCDNTGSSQLNYILGDNRAAAVIQELRYEYGVANNHLYAMGLGKVVGRGKQAAAYGPNRRAQIRLVDKETFDRLKADLDEKREMRVIETQTIPLSESARQEKVNDYKARPSKSVTADKSTTLSKLARQYYDNVYCWVYIYMANIDRIENPNAINEGSVLIIPELTRDELSITKEESLVLYGMSRQLR